MKQRYINVKLNVTADNAIYETNNITLPPDTKEIVAIGLFSKRLDQVDLRGSFKLKLGGTDVFDTETDAKILTTNASVPVKDKLLTFPKPMDVGNRQVELMYKSSNNDLLPFAAHDVTLVLLINI